MSAAMPDPKWRPWPQSLSWQIILVAALALALAQAINFALLLEGRERASETQAASLASARIGLAIDGRGYGERLENQRGDGVRAGRRGIARLPLQMVAADAPRYRGRHLDAVDDRAQAMLSDLVADIRKVTVHRIDMADLPEDMQPRGPGSGYGPPDGNRVDGSRIGKAILVSATLADGRRIEAPAPLRPREPGALGWLILQTLILYLAVLLPLAFFAWWVARPLSRLTERAQAFSGSGEAEMLAPQGPADTRRLIAAFNAMQERVSTLLGEKDVMLGAIGHDLKTPLASLRLRIETLELNVEDETERDKMVATVEEMHVMLDDILMLARLGRSSEPLEPTDADALLAALADDYAVQGKPVAFAGDEDAGDMPFADIAPIRMRPLLVRRALRNLIDNAVLYGGEARLSLSDAADRLDMVIADKGPGLGEAELETLFEPFRRAEASRSRATGGSGLGLTIARAIARAHGGDVQLANAPEGGLIATFSLPRQGR